MSKNRRDHAAANVNRLHSIQRIHLEEVMTLPEEHLVDIHITHENPRQIHRMLTADFDGSILVAQAPTF